jgi:hypothetical protein
MADLSTQSALTAIGDPAFEGFVASTLYSQGWSITYRALDFRSLIEKLETIGKQNQVLLISTDLEGLTPESISKLQSQHLTIFLFSDGDDASLGYSQTVARPTSALELIALVRGSLRTPMIRAQNEISQKVRAKTIAIAGAQSSSGCTTFTINIASELSLSGKKVLIVDAHAHSPAVAILLGQRGLHSTQEVRSISPNLFVIEITQANIESDLARLSGALSTFDFVMIDLGAISELGESLKGRRWESEVLIWTTIHGDEFWVLSKSGLVATENLRKLAQEISINAMKPDVSFIHTMVQRGKSGKIREEAFLTLVMPLRPKRIFSIPLDSRSAINAEREQTTLNESNERSLLRKSIARIAGETTS